jgi:hypothetical protein
VTDTQRTSTRSRWNASAKNSSETETTWPPKASLESSVYDVSLALTKLTEVYTSQSSKGFGEIAHWHLLERHGEIDNGIAILSVG